MSAQARLRRASSMVRGACIAVLCIAALNGCDAFVSPDTRVERAQAHFAKGEYRPAIAQLKAALQKDPEHAAARLELARVSYWTGDLDSAVKELDRAAAAGAAASDLQSLQFEVLFARGNLDEAEAVLAQANTQPEVRRLVYEGRLAAARADRALAAQKFEQALAAAPEDAEALIESARLAAANGDLEPVLQAPARIAHLGDEAHARALLLRGSALMARGEYQSAREALTEAVAKGRRLRAGEQFAAAVALTEADLALKDIEAAQRSLANLTRLGPRTLPAHYFSARIAMLKGDFSKAVADCQRALQIQPTHAQSQLLLAAAHISQGSTEQAQDVLTRLLASSPENVAARKLLAQVYLSRNRVAEAQRLLGAAGASGDSDLEWLRGAALLRGGDTASGLELLERSVASAPNNLERRIDLAGAYIAAQSPEKALPLLSSIPSDSEAAPRAKALQVLATAAGKSRAEARREIDLLLAKRPGDAVLATVAGSYLASIGEGDAARRHLERAIELDSANVEARLSLARLDGAARNLAAAERRLAEVLKLRPDNEAARVGLAEIAWAQGDRAGARKRLEDAISAQPAAVEARLRLAQIAFLEGDPARARGLLDQTVKVAEDRKHVLTSTGQVLARAGLSDEALERFREASAAGDRNALLHASRLHMELGQLGEARQLMESAVKVHPDWREAEQALVTIEAKGGNVEAAIDRAKRLAGDVSPARERMIEGDLYAMAGRSEPALAAYEAAQREEPTGAVAVRMYTLRRSVGSAHPERSLEQWIERSPQDSSVRRVLAGHYLSQGQNERALTQYERLLSADDADPSAMNNLAWLLHQKGDRRALDLAKRAHEAAPDIAEISDTYGWILVQMDKVAAGLPVLERALAKAPANPEIQYHAAFAYAKSGQSARAAELLRKSLQTSEAFPSRAAAENLLQSLGSTTT